jgi:hypothetical protein
MVISSIAGGLGNQMFEYATARRLAHHRNVELKLDLSLYRNGAEERPEVLKDFRREVGLFKFSVTAPQATDSEIARLRDPYSKPTTAGRIVRRLRRLKSGFLWPASHIREKEYRFDPAIMELPGDVYLEGFWQSWKYFEEIKDHIRHDFVPRDPQIAPYARQYINRLRSLGGSVVSLHMRRGDMAHAYEINRPDVIHTGPVGLDYLYAAMERFGPAFHYLIFSDTPKDIDWCKQNVKPSWLPNEQRHFSENHSDIQDMALMSACDHNIIANSTFSWWSAWLNPSSQKRVIAPSRWAAVNAKVPMPPNDLIPPEWEMI